MKKIFAICSLFSYAFLFAQHQVAQKILDLENQKTSFTSVSVLKFISTSYSYHLDKTVSNATIASIDKNVVNDIVAHRYQNIELIFPYNGQQITLNLYKVDLFFDGFHLDTDKQKNVPYQKGVYYRGIIKGDYTSIASFNFFTNELNGVVSNSQLSNLVIGRLDKKSNTTDYVIYSDANLKANNNFRCNYKDKPSKMVTSLQKNATITRCATI